MADGKVDRRQARTKQLLRSALMALIEEKGAEGITVTDITTRADVNRGTFYLHYRDAQDMLEQLKTEMLDTLSALFSDIDVYEVKEYAEKDVPYPKMVRLIEELQRNGDFMKVMFGPKGDLSFGLRMKGLIMKHIWSKISLRQPNLEQFLVPAEYLLAYTVSANLGVLTHWMETGMREAPSEVARFIARIIYHGPMMSSGVRQL
ncbi:TetR/AcrR family transcriptional regulator [Cohnella sp. GCM10027633]|uniref:TetR/AcrR family transcriptional regulator n=1 Tax=unclassified Cohnella TaxID=2636738 RepID=UPI00363CC072